jgi:hypothetical protein
MNIRIQLTLSLISFFVLPQTFSAQSKEYKKNHKRIWAEANCFYEAENYEKALTLYDNIYFLDEDYDEINFRIGTCYFNIPGEKNKSISYFQKARVAGCTEAYFWLARAYHVEEQFSQEKKNYQIYKSKEDKLIVEKEVDRYVDIARRAETAIDNPVFVKIENLGSAINTEYSEVIPFITGDKSKLVFSSKRPRSYGAENDNEKISDFYVSDREGNNWVNTHKIGFEINTEMNDLVVGMNDLGTILLVNRTLKGKDYGNLFLCENKGGIWLKPVMLSEDINSQHKESSACITADGKFIYFSSNRPGGQGGKDIWGVKQLPNGKWAKPSNIGGVINSPYDEEAPFISPNGQTLYFSSNGHETIGGYDIHNAESRADGSWENPKNLGYPINSVDDDIYFSVEENDKTAYYSRFSGVGYGGSDIYEVQLLYKESYLTPVKFIVKDPQTQEPIEAMIKLYVEGTGEMYGDYLPNEKGEFLFIVKPEMKFNMEISAEGFTTNNTEFHITTDEISDDLLFREVVMSN